MKIKDVVLNPLSVQSKQLKKRAKSLDQQVRQQSATKSVAKAQKQLTKAVQRQAKANQVIV